MTSASADPLRARPRLFTVGPIRLCLVALAFEGVLAGLAQARFDAPSAVAVAYAPIPPSSRVAVDSAYPRAREVTLRFAFRSDIPVLSILDDVATAGDITASIPRFRLGPASPETIEKPVAALPANITIAEPDAAVAPAMIVGAASMYDPTAAADEDAGHGETASGEFYDPNGWTAAIQLDLRGRFNGVRYRMRYEPTYALVEARDKRVIVRINDVGPLRPGRIIDLNARAMRFFDPEMKAGVLQAVRVTPLPGRNWFVGPVEDDNDDAPVAQASLAMD
jgi:rare lipoprotein A